jgi:disulfide bond formation protein DsbB
MTSIIPSTLRNADNGHECYSKSGDTMKIRSFIPVGTVALALLVGCAGAPATPTNTPAPTLTPTPSGDAAAGETAFMSTCIACHGADAKGITGLGKDLTTSTFVDEKTDEELIAFILAGRPAGDPLNTTGIDMPPKGGNPALTEEDILNIVAYLRSIHQ